MPREILIVDDNRVNRLLLKNTLEKDYIIIEAENGEEALEIMHKRYKTLSAVFLDIVMPGLDGYEVLSAIRSNDLFSQIPLIMVTGSNDEKTKEKALSLGANDFIVKPYNPEIVRHCLRNNIALCETAAMLNAIQRDKLTGLYSREAFFEKVGEMIKEKEPGYYLLSSFDIDHFKFINDQYGAAEGDRILKEIGKEGNLAMERIGGIACRIAADNFAALIPVAKKDENILQQIQEKSYEWLERSVVFSVGRYYITDTSLSPNAIYDRAYIAKQSVKGRYDNHIAYFDDRMREKFLRDQQITTEMESALEKRQFEVWFQPQYNHVTGALIGAEALARWRHPQKGIIPPGEFIPLFENNGFIYELDKYIWRESCRYLRKWMDAGKKVLPVSVNISRYDIFRADLVSVITRCLKEYNIPVSLLHLEITESAFSKSAQRVIDIVKQLVALGFIIEIDDFGSGYSSLNTLKSVPAQVVKLDMKFLEDDDDNHRGGNILESIVRMTKWLGMAVIAEGVETREQGDFLKSIGCSYVQGYLYARPMPADEYETYHSGEVKEDRHLRLKTIKNLNNDGFWDPNSMDTLIFNSYVGAACVFEFYRGNIELLRITDQWAAMLGGDFSIGDVLKIDFIKHFDEHGSSISLSELGKRLRKDEELLEEFLFVGLPGCSKELFLRSHMRVIAVIEDRYLVYCISENITPQRVAERKERERTQQLQAVLGNVNCGITAVAITDGKGEYLFMNDKYFELFGYTEKQYKKELRGNGFNAVLEEDKPYVKDIMDRAHVTREPASMEYRVRRRGGDIAWLRSYLSITHFDGIEGFVQICTYSDVTVEKTAVQELMDNLPCGAGICVMCGKDARMTYLNKRYFSYFKNNSGRPRNASVFDLIHEDDRAFLREALIPTRKKGGEGTCVIRIKDGENEYIPFRVAGMALKDDEGISTIYVTFVPIAHEKLSVNEMLPVALEKMLASSSNLSFVKDANLQYVCCSKVFAQMVGLENEKDIVGKTDYDLYEKELADLYVKTDRELIESGQSIIDFIEPLPPKDGESRFVCVSKYLLNDSFGNIVGVYGTGRDITQAREAEERQNFLINSIPGGVVICESEYARIEDMKLIYFSDGFCSLLGYTREEYQKKQDKKLISIVAEEYLPELLTQIKELVEKNTQIDFIFRARGDKNGRVRWIQIKAALGEHSDTKVTVNAVLFDVTVRHNVLEQLRISEEENRLAIEHSKNVVCRFDVATGTLKMSPTISPIFEITSDIVGIPYSEVDKGKISPKTAERYIKFYEKIIHGEKSCEAVYERKSTKGWRWIEAHASTIFDSEGKPVSAVLSFMDVTENFERDAAYKKWKQSISYKKPESYSLFRCNISRETVIDTKEGNLLYIDFKPGTFAFNDHTDEYVKECVYSEDCQLFADFLNVDSLMKKYYRGERHVSLDYREKIGDGGYRWLRLTVDLVEYPLSTDVEAHLLFENIDEAKRSELLTIERAFTDPLTGILNRTAFVEEVDNKIRAATHGLMYALFMIDIDGFKFVNDAFGHNIGDRALIDIATLLRSVIRRGDLVGRLGGDEFVIFLTEIPDKGAAAKKAKQICELARRSFSADVHISVSIGIAVYPLDGHDFETLYKKADETLYYVKGSGRDNYAFYHNDMKTTLQLETQFSEKQRVQKEKKCRMLIVDENKADAELLAKIFRDDFVVEKVYDEKTALKRLYHYGTAISVVLLDLTMPETDGFAVLEKIQQSAELRSIPVIVVSGDENRDSALNAVCAGASDFVTKPINPEVLRIRVHSAMCITENERLRNENSSLSENSEIALYRTVIEKIGAAVFELDRTNGTFWCSQAVSELLSGDYDERPLWQIFREDGVADEDNIKKIRTLVEDVLLAQRSVSVYLKSLSGENKLFVINAYMSPSAVGRMDKIILTICEQ